MASTSFFGKIFIGLAFVKNEISFMFWVKIKKWSLSLNIEFLFWQFFFTIERKSKEDMIAQIKVMQNTIDMVSYQVNKFT